MTKTFLLIEDKILEKIREKLKYLSDKMYSNE